MNTYYLFALFSLNHRLKAHFSHGSTSPVEGLIHCSGWAYYSSSIYMFIVYKRVDISIVVMGDASDIIEYGRRRPELSNAALHMK